MKTRNIQQMTAEAIKHVERGALLGKGAWVDRSFAPHLPSFVLVTTPPAGIAARDVGSVVCASGAWTSYVERGNEFADHPTEAEARAAVEAALFDGGK